MRICYRIVLTVIIVSAAYYFMYWVPFSIIPIKEQHWIASLVSMLFAGVVGWFIWSSTGKPQRLNKFLASVVYWALIVGGVGFFAGFFGPLIFTPDANQGPLLGIFITGPVGFLLGAVWGIIRWMILSTQRD